MTCDNSCHLEESIGPSPSHNSINLVGLYDMLRFILLILFLPAVNPVALKGQQELHSGTPGQEFALLDSLYRNASGTDTRFINGAVYQDAYPGATGHPYFLSPHWIAGSLTMMGRNYVSINLKYDLYKDQLLYNHFHVTGPYTLVLNSDRIDGFIIDGHTFLKITGSAQPGNLPATGYCEVLSEGKASLYLRWIKRYSGAVKGSGGTFSQFLEMYVLNDGRSYRVRNRPTLLKALADREPQVKAYLRENRIAPGSGDPQGVKRIIDHYNSLK